MQSDPRRSDYLYESFNTASGSRAPCTGICAAACTISRRSSRVSLDADRTQILLQAMQLRGPRDGHDERLLREQPGESDLRSRGALLLSDPLDQVDHRDVGGPGLGGDSRRIGAEIRGVERRLLVDGPREKAGTEWGPWDEPDAEFFANTLRMLKTTRPLRAA